MNKIVKFGKKNGTTILTIVSMIGVIGTAVASGIASHKAAENKGHSLVIDTVYADNKPKEVFNTAPTKLGYKEYIKRYWKYYIPAVGIGILTCGCIGASESMNKKRQRALIGACALTAETFREYRETVKNIHGEEGEKKVEEEIRNKHYEEFNEKPKDDELLFYDAFSKRYFNATMEHVRYAEYHFNRNFNLRDYAVLNEFYEFLGIDTIPEGDILGWSTWAEAEYGYKWVDFDHEKVTMDDGLECYIISFPFEPHADYFEC